jgi:hypothetical protein
VRLSGRPLLPGSSAYLMDAKTDRVPLPVLRV